MQRHEKATCESLVKGEALVAEDWEGDVWELGLPVVPSQIYTKAGGSFLEKQGWRWKRDG